MPNCVHRGDLWRQLHTVFDLTSLVVRENQAVVVGLVLVINHGVNKLKEVTLLDDEGLRLARLGLDILLVTA